MPQLSASGGTPERGVPGGAAPHSGAAAFRLNPRESDGPDRTQDWYDQAGDIAQDLLSSGWRERTDQQEEAEENQSQRSSKVSSTTKARIDALEETNKKLIKELEMIRNSKSMPPPSPHRQKQAPERA